MILHKKHAGADSTILLDTFPRKVAVAFSGLIRSKLSAPQQAQQFTTVRVTIEGGDPDRLRKVLNAASNSCSGTGIIPYREAPGTTPFVEASLDREAALVLKDDVYVANVTQYMRSRLNGSLSTHEISRLRATGKYGVYRPTYASISATETMNLIAVLGPEKVEELRPLAQYVAAAVWSEMPSNPNRVRASANSQTAKYRGVRQAYTKFNEGVNHFIDIHRNSARAQAHQAAGQGTGQHGG